MAGVQIESHTPLCSYEGKRKSLVNPSLTTGVFSQPCLCMTFDSSKVTLDLNEHACMKHNQIFTVLGTAASLDTAVSVAQLGDRGKTPARMRICVPDVALIKGSHSCSPACLSR